MLSVHLKPSGRRFAHASRPGQWGAAAVELALTLVPFMMVVLAVPEFCKLAWAWNAAAAATEAGVRTAAVCDLDAPAIKSRMRAVMPVLRDEHISIEYLRPGTAGCTAAGVNACRAVSVSLTGYQHTLAVPLLPAVQVSIPAFRTTLPREAMSSAGNPACT